ncbi:probable glycosyltransferase At5g03795 isoform X2 [Actinidia eriantha]|uniref:probable glycosyltransferase At5g03795 isoform X2 n=1 Tax=Actinidia eriantha TaxID=165200 RepID=UPI0025867D72|nr:probable glycosyltransferase At5g03795 isoform X2 [Actinidia eriantha]
MGERVICSSSSSLGLVWIIIPLIVVSGLVGLTGTRTSNWVFTSNHYPWVWSSVIQSSPSSNSNSAIFVGTNNTLRGSEDEASGAHPDLNPRLVVADNHGEEDLSSNESVLNRSSSPPVVKNEESLNTSINGPRIVASMNESHTLPMRASSKRKLSKLMKLEVSLGQARAAIKEARINGNQTQDPDYVPSGPMYWNVNAFQRSYLEMEKQFKVFVYEEGEHPIFHNGPCRSIYAMEGNFIYHMEVSKFRTKDPEKAHVFFLPFSVTTIVRFVYERESHNWAPLKQTVKDYVDLVGQKYPYWNRSLGADHFMLACHDWGPELSLAVPDLYKNSIRALCNANTSEGFNPAKDVSFPEILLHDGTMNHLLGGPSPSKRSVLVFFAGGVHGPIRPILLEHWENKDEDVQVHKYLPKSVSYYGMMRKSKYCICASGYEVASPRMVEALYMGCVPVLIKDHYVPPFSDVLNWKSFSVEVTVKDIPNLKKILTGISTRQYIRLHRRGLQVRRHFEVNFPPKRFDVFHMILHSVWLRRLNVHVRDFEAAS